MKANSCQSLKLNLNSRGDIALTSPLRWCDIPSKLMAKILFTAALQTMALGTDASDLTED